jgi:hypothetical protein
MGRPISYKGGVPRRKSSLDHDPILGRKKTADLLKRLRSVKRQARMLKAFLRDEKQKIVEAFRRTKSG